MQDDTHSQTPDVSGAPLGHRTRSELHSYSPLGQIYEFCLDRYPSDIIDNIDVLYRHVWVWWSCEPAPIEPYDIKSGYSKNSQTAARSPDRVWSKLRILRRRFKGERSLLVTHYPSRRDLDAFLYSITRILAKQGVSISVLASRSIPKVGRSRDTISVERFPKCRVIFEEDYTAPVDRAWARTRYNKLLPAIIALSGELQLDSRQLYATKVFFWEYYLETAMFRRVLSDVRPSVIYGIHYIQNPGYLAAIRQAKARGCRLQTVLIQHGSFNVPEHDFKGADCVILWGEYFKKVLDKMNRRNTPPSIVLGDPKLEIELGRIMTYHQHDRPKDLQNLLYVCQGDSYDNKAMQLFANAMKAFERVKVIYKLHPGQELRDYDMLVTEGLVSKDQVVKEPNIFDLIADADVVVGTRSTALLEAIAAGKPVLQILPELSDTDWTLQGVLGASTEDEIRYHLRLLLEDTNYREAVCRREQRLAGELFQVVDGASARIASYLRQLL